MERGEPMNGKEDPMNREGGADEWRGGARLYELELVEL